MNKHLIILLLGLLMVTMVSAESPLFVFKQHDTTSQINLPVHQNNRSECTNCQCTISITDPNGNTEVSQSSTDMVDNYAVFNLTTNITSINGEHKARLVCSNTADAGVTSFTFWITPSGFFNVLGYYILIFAFVYAIVAFGFLIKSEWIAMLGGMSLFVLGLYTTINGIDIYKNFLTESFSVMTLGVGAIITLITGLELIEEHL